VGRASVSGRRDRLRGPATAECHSRGARPETDRRQAQRPLSLSAKRSTLPPREISRCSASRPHAKLSSVESRHCRGLARARSGLAIAAVVLSAGLAWGGPPAAVAQPMAVAAKTCSGSSVHAVIAGQQKCLRRGELCSHAYAREYKRYGFSCTTRNSRGKYYLT
jgi:hypothetical protein